jgi:OOP family OmpA-OmpF porin
MKKHVLLISFLAVAYANGNAQETVTDTLKEKIEDSSMDSYNRWTVEVNVGQSKGIKPYSEGYYYSITASERDI